MLRIAVCVKQVPAFSEGRMDNKTGVLIRTGKAICNPYDLAAVEAALLLKEQTGNDSTVDVFTMGPPSAQDVLREAFAMGADNGFLLNDSAFAGADVLATSYTLACSLAAAQPYDCIICGRQTSDGDTGQVGGAIAQWLSIPHCNGVTAITYSQLESLCITQQLEEYELDFQLPFPCLIGVEREAFLPRLPSLRLKLAAAKKNITKLTKEDLPTQTPAYFGLSGSATKVKKIFAPPVSEFKPVTMVASHEQIVEIAAFLAAAAKKEATV